MSQNLFDPNTLSMPTIDQLYSDDDSITFVTPETYKNLAYVPLTSPVSSVSSSPKPEPQQYIPLKEVRIQLEDVMKQLKVKPRGRPKGRGQTQARDFIQSRGTRGRPKGRGQTHARDSIQSGGRRGRPKGRGRCTQKIENIIAKNPATEIFRISENNRIANTKVCRHLDSHCRIKHPQNEDLQDYEPILEIRTITT